MMNNVSSSWLMGFQDEVLVAIVHQKKSMSSSRTLIVIGFAAFIAGCASYPQSTEDQITYHATEVLAAVAKSDGLTAAVEVDTLLDKPLGNVKVRELVQKSPIVGDHYVDYLVQRASSASSVSGIASVQIKIETADRAKFLTAAQLANLRKRFGDIVLTKVSNGALPYDLADIGRVPALGEANQQFLATQTIRHLRQPGTVDRSEKLAALLDYARSQGKGSAEFLRIEASLPSIGVKKSEIPAVGDVFPKYASTRKVEVSAPVFLAAIGGDRLWQDDLIAAINTRLGNVDWAQSIGTGVTTLTIEKVRYEERVLPERTQTITYDQYQVNMAAAVLLMPRNATYSFELVTGGASIDYGFVVTATLDGKKTHDQVIRGKVESNYRRCVNTRIKNVFGGESAAGFTANDDMKGRCSGDPEMTIETLREQVFDRVVSGVANVPVINGNQGASR